MANPIRMADLSARVDEINDMIEDLHTEREAIINLMRVLRKGQPVREPVEESVVETIDADLRPSPSEAIDDTLKERPGEFTRKTLVDHLEPRVASDAEKVRNVLYTQLRRIERSGEVWKDDDGLLYLSTHPKARAARRNGTGGNEPAPDSDTAEPGAEHATSSEGR